MLFCPALLISGFLPLVALLAGFPNASLLSNRLPALSLPSTLVAALRTSFLGEKAKSGGWIRLVTHSFFSSLCYTGTVPICAFGSPITRGRLTWCIFRESVGDHQAVTADQLCFQLTLGTSPYVLD